MKMSAHSLALAGVLLGWITARAASPPMIVDPPQNVDTVPGGNASIFVSAIGSPTPRYQWRKNGVNLPDKTNNFLIFSNAQVGDGGSYTVRVWNSAGAITAGPAVFRVLVGGMIEAPTDKFASRPLVRDRAGTVQASSLTATVEAGEPVADRIGRSVWMEWEARTNGVATFNTKGSAFDTHLEIFSGTLLANLVAVTRNDDGGNFYTSQVQFNAVAGNKYQVRLAGFGYGGQGGEFTLSWSLSTNTPTVPVILSSPVAQGVVMGSNATFQVSAIAPGGSYQWFFNGTQIAGATSSNYTVQAAAPGNVGLYSVRVTSGTGQVTVTEPVGLQLTSGNASTNSGNFLALIQDKFQNVGYPPANGNRPGQGWIIGLGDSLSRDVYSDAGDQEEDPNPCDEPLFGTLYQGVTAVDTGLMQVDTTGSAIAARMAIFRGAPGLGEVLLVCDLENGPTGQPCMAQFNASDGTNYTVVVEGYQATGTLKLTCQLGTAPPIADSPMFCWVTPGGDFALSMPATNWSPVPSVQWRLNGVDLPGKTNALLAFPSFQVGDQGSYSVVMSNFVRVATNTVAYLALPGPFVLNSTWSSSRKHFIVRASNAAPFVLETAIDVAGPWQPLATNTDPCVMLVLTNSGVGLDPKRFFRAAVFQIEE